MYDNPRPLRLRLSIIGIIVLILYTLMFGLGVYYDGFHGLASLKLLIKGVMCFIVTSFAKTVLFFSADCH